MPRLPILSRTMLIERFRDGSVRQSDFNLVNTSLGGMIEVRTMVRSTGVGGMVNEDTIDSRYTDVQYVDDATRGQLGINGYQWPVAFNPPIGMP